MKTCLVAHFRRALAAAFLCSLVSVLPPVAGQTVTGTIVGTVYDETGALVPKATVVVTHTATNTARRLQTNERGDYIATSLRPGDYRVAAEQAGFKRTVIENIELLVDQTVRVDLTLRVGELIETVEVTTAPPTVESETSSVGQVIDTHQMVNLPLKNRSFFGLALLSPGVTPQQPGSFVGNRRPTPGGLSAPAFQVGGGRETSNGYLMDGVDAQDPHYLTPSMFPSVDAIQEFKLQTNAYSAAFGRFAAQVNVTTRSGTNELHGSAYEFLRNDKLDAPNFFDNFAGIGKAPLRYNQFGGTLGGPVVIPGLYKGKDRTFFFISYEGTRLRRGKTAQASVPTEAQKSGDFSRLGFRNNKPIFDPATTRPDPIGKSNIRDPFPGNRIPQSRFTDFARLMLPFYPSPVRETATGNNFFTSLSDPSDNNQVLTRFDHHFSGSHNLSVRYSFFDGTEGIKSAIPLSGRFNDVRTQNLALSWTHIRSPATLNELRLGYNRPTYLILQEGAFERDFARELGLKNLLADPIGWGLPGVAPTGFSSLGIGDANPTTQVSNVYQIVDHVTLIRGSHNIKLGGEGRKTNYNDRSERQIRGQFSFTGVMTANPAASADTGVSLADVILGLPLTATGSSTSLSGNFNGFSYAFFVQDDWKVNPKLTLNLGVRYELNTRYSDVQDRLSMVDYWTPGGRILLAGSSRAYIPGTGIVDGPETPRGLVPTDTNNWGPRVGFAFRPFGDNRTAIRAGYGIFYSMIELQDLRTWVRNPPHGEVIGLRSNQNGNSADPDVLRIWELFPAKGAPASRPNVFGPTPDYPDQYYQQWNFTIQQELPGRTLLEVGYIGSKGTRLIQRFNANQANLPDPDNITPILSRRPFPLFGNTIRIGDPGANSTYHGGILRLERRFAGGFSFLGSYTWSKSLDGASRIDDQPRDIRNRSLHKGRSEFDIRHRAVISGTWDIPVGPGKRYLSGAGRLGHLVGGWQLNGILSARSGFPFDVTVQGDVCVCGAANQLANLVGDPRKGFNRSREQWFNTAAFATPRRGTLGNSGRNILDGPGSWELDFSVFKNIPIKERVRLQFRGEFFNIFNHTRFSNPNSQVGNPNYGIIQGAADPRIVQLALKLLW